MFLIKQYDITYSVFNMINAQRRVLITGGCGYLGTYLANYLHRKNMRVRVIDVIEHKKDDYEGDIEFVKSDVRNYDTLCDSIKNVDCIIHGAAALPSAKAKEIYSITVEGTSNILRGAQRYNVERVVYISSTAVYGWQKKIPIEETAQLNGVIPHAKSKIIAEQLCESYKRKGIVIPILRPMPLVGIGRLGIFEILFDWIKDNKKIPLIGTGFNKLQLLDTEDLLEAIYLTIVLPSQRVNDIFNIGAEEYESLEEDLCALIKTVQSTSKIIHLPANAIKFILKILERCKISPIYAGVYAIIDKDLSVSITKIKKQLEWTPKRSNTQALINAYTWYRENHNQQTYSNCKTNKGILKKGILTILKKVL